MAACPLLPLFLVDRVLCFFSFICSSSLLPRRSRAVSAYASFALLLFSFPAFIAPHAGIFSVRASTLSVDAFFPSPAHLSQGQVGFSGRPVLFLNKEKTSKTLFPSSIAPHLPPPLVPSAASLSGPLRSRCHFTAPSSASLSFASPSLSAFLSFASCFDRCAFPLHPRPRLHLFPAPAWTSSLRHSRFHGWEKPLLSPSYVPAHAVPVPVRMRFSFRFSSAQPSASHRSSFPSSLYSSPSVSPPESAASASCSLSSSSVSAPPLLTALCPAWPRSASRPAAFFSFDYLCLTSPESARVFARCWERMLTCLLLPIASQSCSSTSSSTSLTPPSYPSHSPPSCESSSCSAASVSPPHLFRCLDSVPRQSIVCVGDGTRHAAEEALHAVFKRLCRHRGKADDTATNEARRGPLEGKNNARESEEETSQNVEGDDRVSGTASQRHGFRGHKLDLNAEETATSERSTNDSRRREGRELDCNFQNVSDETQSASREIQSLFSPWMPSVATAARLAADLPPRPPILSLLCLTSDNDYRGGFSPDAFNERCIHAPEQHTDPLEDVGHVDPWCNYTRAQRVAVSVELPGLRRSVVCCPCWLQTRVVWPTSALASEDLATTFEERKLREVVQLFGAQNVSVSSAPRSCDQPSSGDSPGDSVYIHPNKSSCGDVQKASFHGTVLPSVSSRTRVSLSDHNDVAFSSRTPEEIHPKTRDAPEHGKEGQTAARAVNDVFGGTEAREKEARSETASWTSLPLFRLQRLNIYTTTQRMLALEERQALLATLREALLKREKSAEPADTPRTAAARATVETRKEEKAQASETESGKTEGAGQRQLLEGGRDGIEAQTQEGEEKGEDGQDAKVTVAFVMLASPSAVWSWVANGLPLEHSTLDAPVLPSYTAIHAGAKQIVVDSLPRKKSSSRSSSSSAAASPASPTCSQAPLELSPSAREGSGQPRKAASHLLSTEADLMRLLEECRNSVMEGREAEKRRRKETQKLVALAIGPTTAAAARHAGFAKVVAAAQPGLAGWTETLFRAIENHVEEEKKKRRKVCCEESARCGSEGERDAGHGNRGSRDKDQFQRSNEKVRVLVLLTREEGKNMELVNLLWERGVSVDFAALKDSLKGAATDNGNQEDATQASASSAKSPSSSSPLHSPSLSSSFPPNASTIPLLREPAGEGEVRPVAGDIEGVSATKDGGPGTSLEDKVKENEKDTPTGEEGERHGGVREKRHNIVMKVLEVPLLRTEAFRGVFKREQSILEELLASNVVSAVESHAIGSSPRETPKK
ncbi:hypothetical protein TGARI_264200 [Toxoplasma gondii ARI]|uniref:Uroporphyrinogen-III synthase n=1 Tax=Toxoplasma gondii ARI TaxID=1074872 RepID=A0A139XQ26_TOXGO|nr:hypothetical protein TGARI_264200 [Toxoplasma gondii ARI]